MRELRKRSDTVGQPPSTEIDVPNMPSWKATKLRKLLREKVLLELCSRLTNSIRAISVRRVAGTPYGLFGSGAMRLRAVPRRDALLLRILRRRRLHQGPHQRLICGDPVGDGVPLCAVPLLEFHAPAPLMIAARQAERCDQALRPQFLEPSGGEAEMLESPLHLRPCQGLITEFAHGRAQPLRREHAAQQANEPKLCADIPFRPRPLPPGIHVGEDVLDEREVSPRAVPRLADEAPGGFPG